MPCERWQPSVTVAAIIERDGRYLLVEEHTPEGLRLNNPAGHLEPGESPLQGVVREALEETARAFTPEALVGVYLARFQRAGDRRGRDLPALRLLRHGGRARARPRAGPRHRAHAVADAGRGARQPRRHRSPLVLAASRTTWPGGATRWTC